MAERGLDRSVTTFGGSGKRNSDQGGLVTRMKRGNWYSTPRFLPIDRSTTYYRRSSRRIRSWEGRRGWTPRGSTVLYPRLLRIDNIKTITARCSYKSTLHTLISHQKNVIPKGSTTTNRLIFRRRFMDLRMMYHHNRDSYCILHMHTPHLNLKSSLWEGIQKPRTHLRSLHINTLILRITLPTSRPGVNCPNSCVTSHHILYPLRYRSFLILFSCKNADLL